MLMEYVESVSLLRAGVIPYFVFERAADQDWAKGRTPKACRTKYWRTYVDYHREKGQLFSGGLAQVPGDLLDSLWTSEMDAELLFRRQILGQGFAKIARELRGPGATAKSAKARFDRLMKRAFKTTYPTLFPQSG